MTNQEKLQEMVKNSGPLCATSSLTKDSALVIVEYAKEKGHTARIARHGAGNRYGSGDRYQVHIAATWIGEGHIFKISHPRLALHGL